MKCKDCNVIGCPNRGSNAVFSKPCTIIEQDSFDWQYFRAEAAKDILAGMMQHKVLSDSSMTLFVPKEQVVSAAIGLADELIKQLKEKEEK